MGYAFSSVLILKMKCSSAVLVFSLLLARFVQFSRFFVFLFDILPPSMLEVMITPKNVQKKSCALTLDLCAETFHLL